jgi:type IV pilus assembly protein PilB
VYAQGSAMAKEILKRKEFAENFAQFLAQQGLVERADISVLTETFGQHPSPYFEDFLLDEGLVERGELLVALEKYYKVPYVDVQGEFFDHQLVSLFPKDVMLRHAFIPYTREGEFLTVITSDPSSEDIIMIIGSYVSYEVVCNVGIPRDICDAVKEFYDESFMHYSVTEDKIEADTNDEDEPPFFIVEE